MSALLQSVAFAPTGDTLWAQRRDDGRVYVAVRPICVALGLDWSSQRQRIMRSEVMAATVVMMTTVAADGKERETVCLPLDLLPGWLFGVEVGRVKEALRPKLIAYQRECFAVLWAHFNGGGAAVMEVPPDEEPAADGDDGGVVALDDAPERAWGVKIALVREARLIAGRDAARRIWRLLDLPPLEDRPAIPAAADALSLFIAERLMDAPSVRTRADDVWRAYLDWARADGRDVVSRKTFGLAMKARYQSFTSGVVWHVGVAVRPQSV